MDEQVTASTSRNNLVHATYDCFNALRVIVEQLKKEREQLRQALEAVEFVDDDGREYCPWCQIIGFLNDDVHHPDCQRQAALRKSDGRRRNDEAQA